MNGKSMSASMSGKQFEEFRELMGMLPRMPRLIPELLLVPNGPKSVTFYGAQQPRTVHCEQGLGLFAKLLSCLDGKHRVEDISALFAAELPAGATGFISLLFRYGLLEEGDCKALPVIADESVASYCARFFGTTLHHQSREEVMAHAKLIQLLIVCPPALISTLSAAFDGVGLHSIQFVSTQADVLQSNYTHALVVLDGGAADDAVLASADALYAAGKPYFIGDIGLDRVHVGPHVLPGMTASHRCLEAQLERPRAACDVLDTEYQCVYVAHVFLQVLLGLSIELYFNRVFVHPTTGHGEYPVLVKVARVPGTAFGGLNTVRALPLEHPAFTAWVHHVGVRPPPREYLSPRLFQMHFTVANINLHDAAVPKAYSPGAISLSAPASLPDPLPWLELPCARSASTMLLAELAAVLRVAVGEQTLDDGSRRRIAPSAGQLQSCSFYVVANHVQGLANGLYQYDGGGDALVPVTTARLMRLQHALYAKEAPLPPVTLIATAHLARVRGKYEDFAYNLVHLDAGVACQYATLAAQAFGWSVTQEITFDKGRVAEGLMLTTFGDQQIACACLHLNRPSMSPDVVQRFSSETADTMVRCPQVSLGLPLTTLCAEVPAALWQRTLRQHSEGRSTERTILDRRATYTYGTSPIDASMISSLVAFMHQTLWTLQSRGAPPLALRPWLLLPHATGAFEAGMYDCVGAAPSEWICRSPRLSRSMLGDCLNQENFREAGAVLVLMADLEQTFATYGQSGYGMLLLQSGSAVAGTWLAASGAGLVGTAAGGLIEAGFMRHAGIDGYRETPMFALALANAVIAQTQAEPDDGAC